ncbi:MAG: tetratricopeptide repeat protein [Planctomycetota bacterium]
MSDDDLPLHEQVDALRRAGDMAGARARIQGALQTLQGEERGRALVALARVNLDSGENTAAVAALDEARKLLANVHQPAELGELLLDLGRAKRRLGALEEALRVLEDATDQFSAARDTAGRRRALAARGKVLYGMHDWKGARGAFRAGLDQKGEDPPSWRLHHAMARAYEKDGRVSEAEEAYERARQAGWDGVGRVRPYKSEEGSAASDLTVSRADVLVDHDDEAELKRTASHLDPRDLLKLVSLTGALNSALAPEPLLELLLDRAIQWSGAERGYVVLCRPVRGEEPRVEVRTARDAQGNRIEKPDDDVSRNIVRDAVRKGAPLVSDNAVGDVRLQGIQSVADRGLRSVACFPLRVRSGPALGALYVESRSRSGSSASASRYCSTPWPTTWPSPSSAARATSAWPRPTTRPAAPSRSAPDKCSA